MKEKRVCLLAGSMALIAILCFVSANAVAQKDSVSVTINGGIFSNSRFWFPDTKDHDFSVRGEKNHRSITMHNSIKSGKYVDDILVTVLIPEEGIKEFKIPKDGNDDSLQLSLTITRNLNDEVVYYHGIRATGGFLKITSADGKMIRGLFEAEGEELDLNTMTTIQYTLKGDFKAIKVN